MAPTVTQGDACGRAAADFQPPGGFACASLDRIESRSPDGESLRAELACFTTERHVRMAPATGLPHDGFDLHVVEFDDQGRPWNEQAVERTLSRIKAALATPAVVVTFVHGWRNNAAVCNNNASCFRDTLEIIAKGERRFADIASRPPRKVVGLFVAWRGASVHDATLVPPFFSFWSRKHAAHVVGDNGAATALFEGVRTAVAADPESVAVFVGHSFGGALLLSAMGNVLNGALQAAQIEANGGEAVVDLNGALFVLVNPALEGSRMQNIFNAATPMRFSRRQLPVLFTLASEADYAVKLAFPLGQSLATWQRSTRTRAQWQSLLQGAGLYKPFHTHVLEAKPEATQPPSVKADSPCACPRGLRRHGDALIKELEPLYRNVLARYRNVLARSTQGAKPTSGIDEDFEALNIASYREFRYSTMEPTLPLDPNSPFLTMKVDDAVVGGHSDIFNPLFLDFLIESVVLSEGKRNLVRASGGGR